MYILVLYYYNHEYPIRATIRDHLYSFRNYSNHNIIYLNVAFSKVPHCFSSSKFDIIIFHTTFISCRWGGSDYFDKILAKTKKIAKSKAIKVALPQDEFIHSNDLNKFFRMFSIQYNFSVCPTSELHKIYDKDVLEQTKTYEVLTGYLDNNTLSKIKKLSKKIKKRDIDIGYRAYKAQAWLGSHGILKTLIAEKVEKHASMKNYITDISTNDKDKILGDKWYEFMLKCKSFIGVEGGSSIHDPDGSIKKKTDLYINQNRFASFNEIKKSCFKDIDNNIFYIAISPRQLEACATKTCQILIEGRYNGILEPGKHYFELKKDFSNLDEILQSIKDDEKRKRIVETAYEDIVKSGKYSYKSFVDQILKVTDKKLSIKKSITHKLIFYIFNLLDRVNWIRVYFRVKVKDKLYPAYKYIKNLRKNLNLR